MAKIAKNETKPAGVAGGKTSQTVNKGVQALVKPDTSITGLQEYDYGYTIHAAEMKPL
jgi:hypothetical protein